MSWVVMTGGAGPLGSRLCLDEVEHAAERPGLHPVARGGRRLTGQDEAQRVQGFDAGSLRPLRSDHPGAVSIGNPHEMTVVDLARLVLEVTGSASPVELVARPQDDPLMRRPGITRARAAPGWVPQMPVAEEMAWTVAWFREQQLKRVA